MRQDQPVLRDLLHPRADGGRERAEPEDAEIAIGAAPRRCGANPVAGGRGRSTGSRRWFEPGARRQCSRGFDDCTCLILRQIFAIFSPLTGRIYGESARAALESALRLRKLDRTLTTALPDQLERDDPSALVPMDVAAHRCVPARRTAARPTVGDRRSALVGTDDAAVAADRGGHAARRDRRARRHVRSARCRIGRGGRHRSRSAAVDSRSRLRLQACGRRHGWTSSTRAEGAEPGPAGRRLRRRRHRSRRRAAGASCGGSVHDVAARAAHHRRQRHRVRAAHAGAAGAQCRWADAGADRAYDAGPANRTRAVASPESRRASV